MYDIILYRSFAPKTSVMMRLAASVNLKAGWTNRGKGRPSGFARGSNITQEDLFSAK